MGLPLPNVNFDSQKNVSPYVMRFPYQLTRIPASAGGPSLADNSKWPAKWASVNRQVGQKSVLF